MPHGKYVFFWSLSQAVDDEKVPNSTEDAGDFDDDLIDLAALLDDDDTLMTTVS